MVVVFNKELPLISFGPFSPKTWLEACSLIALEDGNTVDAPPPLQLCTMLFRLDRFSEAVGNRYQSQFLCSLVVDTLAI